MGAMDHEPTDWGGATHCIWCHDPWPCEVARIRHELAEAIRAEADGIAASYHPAMRYSDPVAPQINGRKKSADLIDVKLDL